MPAAAAAADAPGSELAQKGLDDTPDDIPNAAAEVSKYKKRI